MLNDGSEYLNVVTVAVTLVAAEVKSPYSFGTGNGALAVSVVWPLPASVAAEPPRSSASSSVIATLPSETGMTPGMSVSSATSATSVSPAVSRNAVTVTSATYSKLGNVPAVQLNVVEPVTLPSTSPAPRSGAADALLARATPPRARPPTAQSAATE